MDLMTSTVETALEHYQNKLSRPAYKAYKQNSRMQEVLFADCLKEAIARREMDGKRHG